MIKIIKNTFDLGNDSLLTVYETTSILTLDDEVASIQKNYTNSIIVDKTGYSVVIRDSGDGFAHLWVLVKLN